MINFEQTPIIAAVRTKDDLIFALNSPIEIIFLLNSNILILKEIVEQVHSKHKKLFIHIDFTEGIGKDKFGLKFISSLGIDGIISTRTNIIKNAKNYGLETVQRFFIVDSHSIDTAVEAIMSSKPDMVEIMPGIIQKIILNFKTKVKMPIIAGGLIETKSDIIDALKTGASAISTGKKELWLE